MHPAETPLGMCSAPISRLPIELLLEILSYLRADEDIFYDPHACLWTVLALRGTSRLFRYILPPLTHDEVLDLELTIRATSKSLQACRYCICLRHTSHFAHTQTQQRGVPINAVLGWAGFTVRSREKRAKRFCVDCGFARALDPTLNIGKVRYGKGSDVVVDVGEGESERWVWCWWCDKLKKGEEAGIIGKGACSGSCVACCNQHGCRGSCLRIEQERRKAAIGEWMVERRDLEHD